MTTIRSITASLAFSLAGLSVLASACPVVGQSNPSDSLTTYTTEYSYDSQRRLTTAQYSASEGLSYQYDAAGNVTAVDPVSVLPVELTSFDGLVDGGDVVLTWETASETHNAGFEVQHRPQAVASQRAATTSWEEVAFVEGAGTTGEPQSYQYRVTGLPGGRTHLFRLKQLDLDGTFEYSLVVEVDLGTPEKFALHGAYPNPSRGTATIPYDVPRAVKVRLAVYDVLGRQVTVLVDRKRAPGRYKAHFDANRLATGVYFYRIRMSDFRAVKRLVVVR